MDANNENIVFPDMSTAELCLSEDKCSVVQQIHKTISDRISECQQTKQFDCLCTLDPVTILQHTRTFIQTQCDSVQCYELVIIVLDVWRKSNGLPPFPLKPKRNVHKVASQRSLDRFCSLSGITEILEAGATEHVQKETNDEVSTNNHNQMPLKQNAAWVT